MIPSIPFPSESSRTYEISGFVAAPLVLGNFVFNPLTVTPLRQVAANVLYRIVSIAFSANVPEEDFAASFLSVGTVTSPCARFVQTQGNTVRDITPKPFPVWSFYQYRDALTYFTPSADNVGIGLAFAGTFQGAFLLVPELRLNYSITMQECADERFVKAFTEGKF